MVCVKVLSKGTLDKPPHQPEIELDKLEVIVVSHWTKDIAANSKWHAFNMLCIYENMSQKSQDVVGKTPLWD